MIRVGLTIAGLLGCALMTPHVVGARQEQAGQREADRPDRATLGVLRRDGLLVPFASVNGTNWTMYWPIYLEKDEVPTSLARIPRSWWGGRQPNNWRLWRPSGESQPIEVESPTTVRVHCADRLAFHTNYKSTEPLPAPAEPFPKDGLVIGGNIAVEPIELVAPDSPERATMATALLKDFDRAEERTLQSVRRTSEWRHPFEEEVRRKLPVRIESWYRTPLDDSGWNLSFIEAVRAYPPGPDDEGCGLETLFSGWVYSRGPFVQRADLIARTTYCDRVGALYMFPFARLRARNRSYWVYQMSGWEQEWYTVAEVSRREVRYMVEFPAGSYLSCERLRGR